MTQKTKEMSPSEVLERIRKLQEKESDAYNQIQDANDFFQGFLEALEEKFKTVETLNFFEIAEYTNLKERFQELEESGEASDSEIEDFEDLIGKSIEKAELHQIDPVSFITQTIKQLQPLYDRCHQ